MWGGRGSINGKSSSWVLKKSSTEHSPHPRPPFPPSRSRILPGLKSKPRSYTPWGKKYCRWVYMVLEREEAKDLGGSVLRSGLVSTLGSRRYQRKKEKKKGFSFTTLTSEVFLRIRSLKKSRMFSLYMKIYLCLVNIFRNDLKYESN